MKVASDSWIRRVVGLVLRGLCVMVLAMAARARADDDDGPPIPQPHRVSQEGGATVIKLTPDEQAKAGVRSVALTATERKPTVETFGSVEDVRDLIADQGSFALAQTKVESSTATVDNALAEYRRAQELHQSGKFLSTEQLQAAEETWRIADADLKAARISIGSLKAGLERKWGGTIAGWIFGSGTDMGAMATGRECLIRVSIPDGVPIGNGPVACLLRSSSGTWLTLTPVSPATLLDPQFQSGAYYFLVPAADGLVPGQTLRARLAVGGKSEHGVEVPAGAVVWWQGAAWIYEEMKPGLFTRRPLADAEPQAGGGFFSTTIEPGVKAVVSGADVLLSEETRASAAVPDND